MTNEPHLVLFDADNITGYVFDTGRLKEIRGGSRIVSRCTSRETIVQMVTQHDPQARVIFAGGGSGLVRFASKETARDFAAALRCEYRRQTISGTLSAVSVPYPPGRFAEAVQTANVALRRFKDSQPQHDGQFVANPYTAICVSCGQRPVWASYQTTRGRVDDLCVACFKRRWADDTLHQEAQETRKSQADERSVTLGDLAKAGDLLAQAFLASAGDQLWAGAWLPDELDDLGLLSMPRNYLGFIHADGNRMGEHLRQFLEWLQGRDDLSDADREACYSDFSQAITDATVDALAAALLRAFPSPPAGNGRPDSRSGESNLRVPFDNVLLAGDDMILLVAAHKALDVAIDFCEGFQERMSAEAQRLGYTSQITTSAGVVLANVHQPILYLQQQAKELQRGAKRLSTQWWAQNESVSSIDFTVVTTPVLRPLRAIRKHDYTIQEKDRELRLTRRPYTTGDLRELLHLGRLLKGVIPGEEVSGDVERRSYPRSQLHALYDAIFQGYDQGSLQGARASLRVSAHQRKLLQDFARRFESDDPLPWGPVRGATTDQHATAFPDLVELYDFLHHSEQEEASDV
ncbi:MAG: hypothetical protein QHJ81_14590 [Anaerolineae bacterium]|nr:hypothetical protein [Anaerolineae bacterium]